MVTSGQDRGTAFCIDAAALQNWGAKVLNRTSTVGSGTDELAGSAAGWSAT